MPILSALRRGLCTKAGSASWVAAIAACDGALQAPSSPLPPIVLRSSSTDLYANLVFEGKKMKIFFTRY